MINPRQVTGREEKMENSAPEATNPRPSLQHLLGAKPQGIFGYVLLIPGIRPVASHLGTPAKAPSWKLKNST